MQAARTQIEAKEPADRPNFMQIFNAPVGAVAQGEASIGSVTQTNSSDIREQLRELANLIGDARQELGAEGSAQIAAALGAVQAEAEAENPSVGMVKAALQRVVGFLERAGSGAAGGALLAYARLHGWL